ncbi:hypothetical protein [Aquibium microcysteis]|uniref:hypothetical protein n=1 Tax=Aquibium microcysteis TaxID=675281 RepID=UPI00165D1105|nr:hypothetical protein [Aquibium microcysteis]
MFQREKRTASRRPKPAADDGNPWDSATLAKIGEQKERISLHLTHLEVRRRFGARPNRAWENGTIEVIGTGFVPHLPQHVHMELTFEHTEGMGVVAFDYQMAVNYLGTVVHLPVLRVVLNDPDHSIALALREGMRDALASGETGLEVRCWCTFHEGWAQEQSQRIDLTGFNIWSNLASPRIAGWQRPISEIDLSDIPDPTKLRSRQDR